MAMAVEQAAETIVITDIEGTILYVNPAFEKTTGYTIAEALGQNPRILKSGKPLQVSVLPTGGLPAATAFSSGGAVGLKL